MVTTEKNIITGTVDRIFSTVAVQSVYVQCSEGWAYDSGRERVSVSVRVRVKVDARVAMSVRGEDEGECEGERGGAGAGESKYV